MEKQERLILSTQEITSTLGTNDALTILRYVRTLDSILIEYDVVSSHKADKAYFENDKEKAIDLHILEAMWETTIIIRAV